MVKIPILDQIEPFWGPMNPRKEGSTIKNHQNGSEYILIIPLSYLF